MKITAGTRQREIRTAAYQAKQQPQENQEEMQAQAADATDSEAQRTPVSLTSPNAPTQGTSSGNNKIKASVPDDQVGVLASQLASSQTKFDVQQVSSKAMRALANLRMSGALNEGKEKEKIAQMIRRMEKLLKRVRTKMRQLTKEEQLENRQKRAEEERKEQEARNLKNELRSKRTKRQRDEWNYAIKESTRGNGNDNGTINTPLPGANAGMPDISVSIDAAAPAVESISLDVTV